MKRGRGRLRDISPAPSSILGYLESAFEEGDPEPIAATLNEVARARGPDRDVLTARADRASVIGTLKALGLELTAKAA